VGGRGGWTLITGGVGTPEGRYNVPTCGGGVGTTGVALGPGNCGRLEPTGTPVPGYNDNNKFLDTAVK